MSQVHESCSRTHNSNLFANYRVELCCAQVQLVYKTNLKIVLKIDSFMNRTELESNFFRTEHRAVIERINSFTALHITDRMGRNFSFIVYTLHLKQTIFFLTNETNYFNPLKSNPYLLYT